MHPAILSVQETKSWDIPNWELEGFVCYGDKLGYATLLVSEKVLHKLRRDVQQFSSEQPW